MNKYWSAYSLQDKIRILESNSMQDSCNGDCDEKPPHKECTECLSARLLNECNEVLNEFIK